MGAATPNRTDLPRGRARARAHAARKLLVSGGCDQDGSEQGPVGLGWWPLSAVGVVALEVGKETVESFQEAFQVGILPLMCAAASKVFSHLREHAQ